MLDNKNINLINIYIIDYLFIIVYKYFNLNVLLQTG